jgi:hypothetical protein
MVMLLSPLFFADLSNNGISKQENRVLAERSPLSTIKQQPGIFMENFNAWFNDHVGFRENMITFYKKLDKFETEGHLYTNGGLGFIVGREGHHFFTGFPTEMIPKFQGKNILDDKQLQETAKKLNETKEYLEGRGIHFIVMLCADKETIYPEYYPNTVKRGAEPVQLDIITEYIKKNTDVDIFNIREALLSEKENYLLYAKAPPGDLTHYNEIGAFFAYRELMNHINTYFSQFKPYTLNDVDIKYDENGMSTVSLKQEPSYKKLGDDFQGIIVFENDDTNLPVILFMRDSYGNENYFTKYICEHFGKTILIHYQNMKNLEKYIDTFNPDIVVFETAERQIGGFASLLVDSR